MRSEAVHERWHLFSACLNVVASVSGCFQELHDRCSTSESRHFGLKLCVPRDGLETNETGELELHAYLVNEADHSWTIEYGCPSPFMSTIRSKDSNQEWAWPGWAVEPGSDAWCDKPREFQAGQRLEYAKAWNHTVWDSSDAQFRHLPVGRHQWYLGISVFESTGAWDVAAINTEVEVP